MKKNLLVLLIALLVIAAGCVKKDETPVIIPQGTFSGSFTRLHYSVATKKLDTLKANLVIKFSTTTGYAVLSDTSVVHAGSKGGYIVDPLYIQFLDSTIPVGPVPTTGKVHLAGIYEYLYQGNSLKFSQANDTLGYYYDLTLTP
jgi:hypothetical protein